MAQQELRKKKLYMMVFGKTLKSHLRFMDRLRQRINVDEGLSAEDSDIIIAFVAISSRAGTDIEAALQGIPQVFKPVVLVVLHHTFDEYFVVPESKWCVDRDNVFTVDCLFYEDQGFLPCLRNDEALKAVTDHLISLGASDRSMNEPDHIPGVPKRFPCWKRKLILGGIVVATVGVSCLVIFVIYVVNQK